MGIPPTTYPTAARRPRWQRTAEQRDLYRGLLLTATCQPPSAISAGAGNDLSAVRGKVFLLQNPAVMQFMAGNDVGKCADRDLILVGDAATRPGRFVKIPK